jgi:geranylgeranyl diphosphate synthase type II
MQTVSFYQKEIKRFLEYYTVGKEPEQLYHPIEYILQLGGKRLRPVLALMSADAFGGNYKEAIHAAMAVEVFHNFSLIHDDIMDEAPLRRGKLTVHKKWNVNTGILSGDAMLVKAYQLLEDYEPHLQVQLTQLFSKTALQVCEGQQYDMDFETRTNVTINEYLQMISYKTAVLVACSLQMGALIANASKEDAQAIYNFGLHLGIAFQLQDDYLDAFGNPETFGKQVGGDIIENKKTYLYLKALELATEVDKNTLLELFTSQPNNAIYKVQTVKEIFITSKASDATQEAIESYTKKAFVFLESTSLSLKSKAYLQEFGQQLMSREV